MTSISTISAYQIFDSRGVPTLEAEVVLDDGTVGYGLVPSGASTGQFEAHELRDNDLQRFRGKSVTRAVRHVEEQIADALRGCDPFEQRQIDQRMIDLDGTQNKSRLGANAILGVSMAVANAAAARRRVPLYEYLAGLADSPGTLLPLPEIQILGGGAHADWRTDVQDFLLIAVGAATYVDSLEITHNVYHAAGDLLRKRGQRFGLADEGGYWPVFRRNEEALELMFEAIDSAGYTPGRDASISLDIAASDLYDSPSDSYRFALEGRTFSSAEFVDLMLDWCNRFPVVSIEDPLADTDRAGWKRFRQSAPPQLQIIGDDLFTTNAKRIEAGIASDLANSVLIKLNQIGTVTETIDAIRQTKEAGWQPVVSARSGETEDAFIAHLSVGTDAGQLKVGSFARSERLVKWNEVLRIRRRLGQRARFDGAGFLSRLPAPTLDTPCP